MEFSLSQVDVFPPEAKNLQLPKASIDHYANQCLFTALYYACVAPVVPAPRRKNRFVYFIRIDKFMEESYDEAFEYDWTRRGEKVVADQLQQFENHLFPLSVIGKGGWELGNWVQNYEKHWLAKEDSSDDTGDEGDGRMAGRNAEYARAFGTHLKGISQEYQIAYIELDRDLELDKVCDIFTQINSRGIRLDVFDLINALLVPKGLQLKHLWREAAPRLDFVENEIRLPKVKQPHLTISPPPWKLFLKLHSLSEKDRQIKEILSLSQIFPL